MGDDRGGYLLWLAARPVLYVMPLACARLFRLEDSLVALALIATVVLDLALTVATRPRDARTRRVVLAATASSALVMAVTWIACIAAAS